MIPTLQTKKKAGNKHENTYPILIFRSFISSATSPKRFSSFVCWLKDLDMNQVLNVVMTTFMQVLRMPIMIIGAFVMGIVTIPRFWWLQVAMFRSFISSATSPKRFSSFVCWLKDLITLIPCLIQRHLKWNLMGLLNLTMFHLLIPELNMKRSKKSVYEVIAASSPGLFSTFIPTR